MRIGAVVVLYNPDVGQTEKSIQSLLSQVDCIYIVDNSDIPSFMFKDNKIVYNPLCRNIGIAAAQNIGIRFFVEIALDTLLSAVNNKSFFIVNFIYIPSFFFYFYYYYCGKSEKLNFFNYNNKIIIFFLVEKVKFF